MCLPSGCSPSAGWDPSVCSWYDTGNIDNPPPDPSGWQGGDFLPSGYRSAAQCACSGGGNPLWNLAAASCVRKYLLQAHMSLNDTMKKNIREATLSWNPVSTYTFVDFIYEMHEDAYASCCCSGKVAPQVTWYGVFFLGKILPCYLNTPGVGADIVSFILEFGRCGCGW